MKSVKAFAALTVLLLVLASAPSALALDYPPTPTGDGRYVADFADILTPEEEVSLAAEAKAIESKTTAEVLFLTVILTDPSALQPYSTELGHRWGVGKADVDNGVIIAVAANRKEAFLAPKKGDERQAYVTTGYGVGGAIPDITAKRIVTETMKPFLAKGNYAAAFSAAGKRAETLLLADAGTRSKGKATAAEPSNEPSLFFLFSLFFAIAAVAIVVRSLTSRRRTEEIFYKPRRSGQRRIPSPQPVESSVYYPPVIIPADVTPNPPKPTRAKPTGKKRVQEDDDDDSYGRRSSTWDSGPSFGGFGSNDSSSFGSSGNSDSGGSFGGGDFGGGGGGDGF